MVEINDWDRISARYEAFWHGEIIDRPLIQITVPAPRKDKTVPNPDPRPMDSEDLYDWTMNPDRAVPRMRDWLRKIRHTCFRGDALPVVFPVPTSLPAIQAAYLGGDYEISPENGSGWCQPVIDDLDQWQPLDYDQDNQWWRDSLRLFREAAAALKDDALLGIPDLQGGGQILDSLRGTIALSIDLIERPDEVIKRVEQINTAWFRYWKESNAIFLSHQNGYLDWLRIWSKTPAVTVELDFSAMISPQMFDELFLPGVVRQIELVGRTIYHLDGPDAVRHLDSLLALESLNGIQWVPGAGAAPMPDWIPLLKRIQFAGKLLVFSCAFADVETIMRELKPEGVLIQTTCPSPEAAEELLKKLQLLGNAPNF